MSGVWIEEVLGRDEIVSLFCRGHVSKNEFVLEAALHLMRLGYEGYKLEISDVHHDKWKEIEMYDSEFDFRIEKNADGEGAFLVTYIDIEE